MLALNFTLVWFFFPETKGKGLEEVAEIFDGPDALAGVNAMRHMGLAENPQKALYAAEEVEGTEKQQDVSVQVQQRERV